VELGVGRGELGVRSWELGAGQKAKGKRGGWVRAVGSTMTLQLSWGDGRTGIQHRVWMTGNQPEQDPWLPRSCALAERAA